MDGIDGGVLFRGLLIGFTIAAPVGPIGVLCIRRTLAHGRAAGLATGLGAATADACYGAIAGLGVTAVMSALLDYAGVIRLVGGLLICYLGVKTFVAAPAAQPAAAAPERTVIGAYLSAVALTITNPATILSFAAIFAGVGVGMSGTGPGTVALLVGGVFVGSSLWWLLLSGGVSLVRGRIGVNTLPWINRLSGVVLIAFGVLALVSLRE